MTWRRFLCAIGYHYWRRVYRETPWTVIDERTGLRVRFSSGAEGDFTMIGHRCKWCHKGV